MAAPEAPVLAGVSEVVVVHSAKGGVGKSTTAANLAVTFSRLGLSVGLLDADIHGPSIAHMFGSSEQPLASPRGEQVLPLERHGVKYLSIANVTPDDGPIIWRGPMVAGALKELLTLVDWGELDLLLVDMPPGTGDTLLSLGQSVPLSGVVTVTSPQELALADTRRGIRGFEQLQVPHLGLVENMAGFVCDECGDVADLFGSEGGERTATDTGIPFLGRIPLDPALRVGGDAGIPLVASATQDPSTLGDKDGAAASRTVRAFDTIARAVLAQLALHGRAAPGTFDVTWESRDSGEIRREPSSPITDTGADDQAIALWQASEDLLAVRWGDGTTTFHRTFDLRRACPCAGCVDEWTREELPTLDDIPADVKPVTIRSVGRYAIQPVWSDGHRTGIYSFRDLRSGLAQANP